MFERPADPSDQASLRESAEIDAVLARHRAASQRVEDPDEDAEGRRYCLDCAEIIPPERVRLVDAVRCVHCASMRERGSHLRRQVGGAIRIAIQSEESGAGDQFSDYNRSKE
ncbi:hypothetical protein JKG47_12830 [Acidithiobacillus sp. MC6.1]|nr:hypothetical protein [Acidithiobacillus sp. MC6.1]